MEKKTRRLSFRIWLLGIVLAISLIGIIVGDGYLKLLVFLLIIGLLYLVNRTKSGIRVLILGALILGIVFYLITSSVATGAIVQSIGINNTLFDQGLREGDVIKSVNGEEVLNPEGYEEIINGIFDDGEGKRVDIATDRGEFTAFLETRPEVGVGTFRNTNIETVLDLRGGARALVKSDVDELSDTQLEELIAVSRNRFNVFGLTDVDIRGVNDLEGNKFMLIEIAGATPDDLETLVGQQGKFEARISNQTVFVGEDRDISDVCRNDASCAGITRCLAQQDSVRCWWAIPD